ncbi:unnamed protein product [Pleuronectes platessa]|uniref:Uncharacterized protein n=1 Tax=Pleuronectes platessa TaxID=8262 RepID=A0A9N7Z2P9_PLEPL|nr:unnamed protein product [Pleuronectes platessa]
MWNQRRCSRAPGEDVTRALSFKVPQSRWNREADAEQLSQSGTLRFAASPAPSLLHEPVDLSRGSPASPTIPATLSQPQAAGLGWAVWMPARSSSSACLLHLSALGSCKSDSTRHPDLTPPQTLPLPRPAELWSFSETLDRRVMCGSYGGNEKPRKAEKEKKKKKRRTEDGLCAPMDPSQPIGRGSCCPDCMTTNLHTSHCVRLRICPWVTDGRLCHATQKGRQLKTLQIALRSVAPPPASRTRSERHSESRARSRGAASQ